MRLYDAAGHNGFVCAQTFAHNGTDHGRHIGLAFDIELGIFGALRPRNPFLVDFLEDRSGW